MLNLQNKIVLKFRLKAYHSYYLNRFVILLKTYLNKMQYLTVSCVSLPKTYERFTILRSPHVDIRARDQFERITHNKLFIVSFYSNELNLKGTIMHITTIFQKYALGLDVWMTSQIKSLNN